MLYSKGDTLEIYNGRIALVLDNGMCGRNFVGQYEGQMIPYFNSFIKILRQAMVVNSYAHRPCTTIEEVWYHILVGDKQGWVEERRLWLARLHIGGEA